MDFKEWKTRTEERAQEVYKDPAVYRAVVERQLDRMEHAYAWFMKWVSYSFNRCA